MLVFSVDGVEQLTQTPRSVFLQPVAQSLVGTVTAQGDSSAETVEVKVVHCHVSMGNAALCSYMRALQSTGISGFTSSQLKPCTQRSCLLI